MATAAMGVRWAAAAALGPPMLPTLLAVELSLLRPPFELGLLGLRAGGLMTAPSGRLSCSRLQILAKNAFCEPNFILALSSSCVALATSSSSNTSLGTLRHRAM